MSAAESLTVGVLGGMGPDATVDFIAKVIAATPAEVDEDHLRLLVDHNPLVPSRQAAILADGEDPGVVIAGMAKGLEAAGADFLVMPCNTAHAYAGDIVAAITVPFLSIIDVTVDACAEYKRVGLMATAACLKSKIYERVLIECGIGVVGMKDEELSEFTRQIAEIKKGNRGADVSAAMRALAVALQERGAEVIVAGCTEIPLVLDTSMLDIPLISSTDLLAEATVARAKTR